MSYNTDNIDIEKPKDFDGLDVELLNIFTYYYQNAFSQPKKSMFDNIDYEKLDSINRVQELLYDEIKKYEEQEKNEELITLNKPGTIDLNKFNEIYCLSIKNKEKAVCSSLLALLKYVQIKIDWKNTIWIITKIK